MNVDELKPGDNAVLLLDARCPAAYDELLRQDDEVGRSLAAWHAQGADRFMVALLTNFQMVNGKPSFNEHLLLVLRDADALLAKAPELMRTSGGSLWLTFVMDDVEPQIHALLKSGSQTRQ